MPLSRRSTLSQMSAALSDLLNNPSMRPESSAKPTLLRYEVLSAIWLLLHAMVTDFHCQ